MLFASPTVTMLNPPERPRDPSMQQIHDAMPEMFRPTDSSLNCGNCTQFDGARRLCVLRNLLVKPETIQCDFYDPQPEDGEEDY